VASPWRKRWATLEYTPRAAARLVEKVLRSAVANAEHNYQCATWTTCGSFRRTPMGAQCSSACSPRAMGRAFSIKHRTSHLTIGVSDEVNGAVAVPAPAPARPSTPPPAREERPAARRAPARRGAARGAQKPAAKGGPEAEGEK